MKDLVQTFYRGLCHLGHVLGSEILTPVGVGLYEYVCVCNTTTVCTVCRLSTQALPPIGPDSSGPPCLGVEGVLRLESRLWRRLQWLITQQFTQSSCPLHPPNIYFLAPSQSSCFLSFGSGSWHTHAYVHRWLTEEKRLCLRKLHVCVHIHVCCHELGMSTSCKINFIWLCWVSFPCFLWGISGKLYQHLTQDKSQSWTSRKERRKQATRAPRHRGLSFDVVSN